MRYPGILLGESYSGIHALADFIHDVTKYQQAFWRHCRGTVATLSSNSVVLVSPSFSFLLPLPPLTHGEAILEKLLYPMEFITYHF